MDRIKKRWRAMSLRQAFIVYVLIALAAVSTAVIATLQTLSKIVNHVSSSESVIIDSGLALSLSWGDPSRLAKLMISFVHVAGVVLPVLYVCLTLYLVSKLYYDRLIKKPVARLSDAAQRIKENDLDFSIHPCREDELGTLCKGMETMRQALLENNQAMWKMMEERKRVNAAFAHDLRTPLTVLQGYQEFLLSYLPQGKVEKEKLMDTLSAMQRHTMRLEGYVDTMNQLVRLEDIAVKPEPYPVEELISAVRAAGSALEKREGCSIEIISCLKEGHLHLDAAVVQQVVENLLSNAVRYTKTRVLVTLEMEGERLVVTVCDDGDGFLDEEAMRGALEPYTKEQGARGAGHLGMGLYIVNTLCARHGGETRVENGAPGAKITVSFFCG